MARLIRRSEALTRINQLEEKAVAAGDLAGAEWIVKCWNAVRSCRVEDRNFCTGKGRVRENRVPDREE